jgi:hypothetical protein
VIKKIFEFLKIKTGKKNERRLTSINFLANAGYKDEWKIHALNEIISTKHIGPSKLLIIEKFGRNNIEEYLKENLGEPFVNQKEDFKMMTDTYHSLFGKKIESLKYVGSKGKLTKFSDKIEKLHNDFLKDMKFYKDKIEEEKIEKSKSSKFKKKVNEKNIVGEEKIVEEDEGVEKDKVGEGKENEVFEKDKAVTNEDLENEEVEVVQKIKWLHLKRF